MLHLWKLAGASERHCPPVLVDAPAEWCVCIAAAWEERRVNEGRPNHEDSIRYMLHTVDYRGLSSPTSTSDSNGTQRVVVVGLTWGEDLRVAQVPSPLDIQRLPNRNCYNEVKTTLRFFLASLFTHLVNSIPLHRVRTLSCIRITS